MAHVDDIGSCKHRFGRIVGPASVFLEEEDIRFYWQSKCAQCHAVLGITEATVPAQNIVRREFTNATP